MPNTPNDLVYGRVIPIIDQETGRQVEDPKRGKKWQIIAMLPRQYDRKQKRPRKYRNFYGSERQANKEKDRFVFELNEELNQRIIPSNLIMMDATKITFGEYAETWLKAKENVMRRNTWEYYASTLRRHIIPLIGHIFIGDITPIHLSRYKEIKLANGGRLDGKPGGLSSDTVNKHLSAISDVLRDAASPEKKLIPYNSAILVDRVKKSCSNKNDDSIGKSMSMVNCLTIRQLNELLSKLEKLYSLRRLSEKEKLKPETIKVLKSLGFSDTEISSRAALFKLKVTTLYPIVYIVSRTGMRLSEALALKWANIDFDAKIIKVYASSHFGKKKEGEESGHFYNTTKEGKPKAYIDITDKDVSFLKQHRKEQLKQRMLNKTYTDNDLVFAKKDGTHLVNSTIGSVFTDFAFSNGFNVTFHGLRHTHCTLLIANGASIEYVARRVGHSNSSTTSRFYWHAEKTNGPNLGEMFQSILDSYKIFLPEELLDAEKKAKYILDHIGG